MSTRKQDRGAQLAAATQNIRRRRKKLMNKRKTGPYLVGLGSALGLAVLGLFLALGGLMGIPVVEAFPSGITGYSGNPATNGGAICTNCHSGGIVPTVTLSGPPSVAPSATNSYALTISFHEP